MNDTDALKIHGFVFSDSDSESSSDNDENDSSTISKRNRIGVVSRSIIPSLTDSGQSSGLSDFDDDYYAVQPPPISIKKFKDRIVKIKAKDNQKNGESDYDNRIKKNTQDKTVPSSDFINVYKPEAHSKNVFESRIHKNNVKKQKESSSSSAAPWKNFSNTRQGIGNFNYLEEFPPLPSLNTKRARNNTKRARNTSLLSGANEEFSCLSDIGKDGTNTISSIDVASEFMDLPQLTEIISRTVPSLVSNIHQFATLPEATKNEPVDNMDGVEPTGIASEFLDFPQLTEIISRTVPSLVSNIHQFSTLPEATKNKPVDNMDGVEPSGISEEFFTPEIAVNMKIRKITSNEQLEQVLPFVKCMENERTQDRHSTSSTCASVEFLAFPEPAKYETLSTIGTGSNCDTLPENSSSSEKYTNKKNSKLKKSALLPTDNFQINSDNKSTEDLIIQKLAVEEIKMQAGNCVSVKINPEKKSEVVEDPQSLQDIVKVENLKEAKAEIKTPNSKKRINKSKINKKENKKINFNCVDYLRIQKLTIEEIVVQEATCACMTINTEKPEVIQKLQEQTSQDVTKYQNSKKSKAEIKKSTLQKHTDKKINSKLHKSTTLIPLQNSKMKSDNNTNNLNGQKSKAETKKPNGEIRQVKPNQKTQGKATSNKTHEMGPNNITTERDDYCDNKKLVNNNIPSLEKKRCDFMRRQLVRDNNAVRTRVRLRGMRRHIRQINTKLDCSDDDLVKFFVKAIVSFIVSSYGFYIITFILHKYIKNIFGICDYDD